MAVLKYILRIILPAVFATTALSSCYSDFDPGIDSTSVLCMNAAVTAGKPLQVELTRTWRWDELLEIDNSSITVKDAVVKLYVNDQYTEDLVYREVEMDFDPWIHDQRVLRVYCADNYVPASGDHIRLEAFSEKYGYASAVESIPGSVTIDRIEPVVSAVSVAGNIYRFDLSLLIYFTDPDDVTNFYQLNVSSSPYLRDDKSEARSGFSSLTVDMSNEPLFTEHVSTLESVLAETWGYSFFSDRQISGQSYPLHIMIKDCEFYYSNPDNLPEYEDVGLDIDLMSLSESYYKHVLSVWEVNDGLVGSLGSVGLGEIVPAYSNVSSRAGIVAGNSVASVRLSIPRLLKQHVDIDTQE